MAIGMQGLRRPVGATTPTIRSGRAFVPLVPLMVLLVCTDAWAYKPNYRNEVRHYYHSFNDDKLDLVVQTRTPSTIRHQLDVYRGGTLLVSHKVGCASIFADEGKAFFLCVSLSDLTPDAYVVFDRDWQVITRGRRSGCHPGCQCKPPPYLQWYDESNPAAKFRVDSGVLKEVSILACNGKRIVLFPAEPR